MSGHNLATNLANDLIVVANNNISNNYDDLCIVAMWRAVIWQALLDIETGASKKNKLYNEALLWLNEPDFVEICELAYLSPHAVRSLAEQILQNNHSIKKIR